MIIEIDRQQLVLVHGDPSLVFSPNVQLGGDLPSCEAIRNAGGPLLRPYGRAIPNGGGRLPRPPPDRGSRSRAPPARCRSSVPVRRKPTRQRRAGRGFGRLARPLVASSPNPGLVTRKSRMAVGGITAWRVGAIPRGGPAGWVVDSTGVILFARMRALRVSARDSADHGPGACGQLEWAVTHPQTPAESVAKCGLVVVLERLAERAGGTNSGRQRRPQILEVRVLRGEEDSD